VDVAMGQIPRSTERISSLAYISSQVCRILLHLLNVWRSDAAQKSMFDFR